MEPDLISKKELLDITGISYGQLYRWKRKNLIPEEWFIRKSTFTGQETFFPKDKILARVQRIMTMKDERSLDEIAGDMSPNPTLQIHGEDIVKRNIVSLTTLDFALSQRPGTNVLSFEELLYVYVLDKLIQGGAASFLEGSMVLECLREHYPKLRGKSCSMLFVRKLGVSMCLLTTCPDDVYFDAGARLIADVNVAASVEELSMHLAGLEG